MITHGLKAQGVTYLTLNDGKSGQPEAITTTTEHPFYVQAQADTQTRPRPVGHEELNSHWVGAGHLQIGDKIREADGTVGTVANVVTVQQTMQMFNLTVDEAHTFYVGQDGWLVHNAGVGPNGTQNIVYRVIRPNENPASGLFAPFQDSARNITGHVLNGSKEGYSQSWISTTRDYNVALQWAQKDGSKVVAIDLSKVNASIVDISTPEGRAQYLKGVTANNRAAASAEVLIDRHIPANAIMFVTGGCE